MENFNFTDEEQKTFAEWFSALDIDKQTKLSLRTVTHFLLAYQLSDDNLEKIFNICGAKRLGHFGRSQFYIALKLVALAQNGYELSLDNLANSNLPLPRKLSTSSSSTTLDYDKLRVHQLNSIDSLSSSSSPSKNSSSNIANIPPPPKSSSKSTRFKQTSSSSSSNQQQLCKFCNKNLISTTTTTTTLTADSDKNLRTFVLVCPNCKNLDHHSPNNELTTTSTSTTKITTNNIEHQQNLSDPTESSTDDSRCSSTELYETIDNTSLAFENLKPWEKTISQAYIDGQDDEADESKHCLLNDDEERDVDTNNKICLNINSLNAQYDSLGSNYKQPSVIEEETSDEDVWSMNDEQIKYYFEKFCQLLPTKQDRLLAGVQVKSFFEKSKLSLNDLKTIWTLSDLDVDGYLSIIEFCIAMHLIVLKRNQVPLPDTLPSSLQPLKINQQLQRNQLALPDDQQSFNSAASSSTFINGRSMNSSLTPDITSLTYPNHHLSTGNVSTTINISHQLRNSFDNIKNSSVYLRNNNHHHYQDTAAASIINNTATTTTTTSNSIASSGDLLSSNDNEIVINSLNNNNREWTKFNNSPFTTTNRQPLQNTNYQRNNLQSSNNVSNPMTPANFTDKIELNPKKLIHPLALKVSNQQQFTEIIQPQKQVNNNNMKDTRGLPILNPPAYLPRPRGHARSSSLDLNREIVNNSTTFHHGAFVNYRNYRKHIEQQQKTTSNHQLDTSNATSTKKDRQFYLNLIKSKYPLPEYGLNTFNSTNSTPSSIKEHHFLVQCIYDELINEFASTLEQLSIYQQQHQS